MRDSVSWIRPDNNLDIEASDTNLGIHVEFKSTLVHETNIRESQLLGQLRDIFGEDVSYTRLNDFEIILSSDKLSNINLARRLGRLRAKRDDIRKAELFTTKTETVSHNWSEDATGESIRSEIRELGFGDILAWVDDRRTSYLDLAEEFGATEVTQYRAPPRAPPSEATAPDVELSLAGNKYPMAPRDRWHGEGTYKEAGGSIVNMTPDEFLANAQPVKIDELTRENVEDLKQHIRDGGELDPLTLYDIDLSLIHI